jgi:hypothetical protein
MPGGSQHAGSGLGRWPCSTPRPTSGAASALPSPGTLASRVQADIQRIARQAPAQRTHPSGHPRPGVGAFNPTRRTLLLPPRTALKVFTASGLPAGVC